MILHVFTSLLGGVPLCIPQGLYNGISLGGTTRGKSWRGYPGRVLSYIYIYIYIYILIAIVVLLSRVS